MAEHQRLRRDLRTVAASNHATASVVAEEMVAPLHINVIIPPAFKAVTTEGTTNAGEYMAKSGWLAALRPIRPTTLDPPPGRPVPG